MALQKLFFILAMGCALVACERQDIRTQAANIVYNNCIESGEDKQWCRCLRADLIDSTKQFTEEMADYTLQGRQHPWLSTAITGARIRCKCRTNPQHMAARGLSCDGVKPIKY